MRAIYAFYSKPFGGNILNAKTHWHYPYAEFLVLAYSVSKMKEYGFETILFCDKYGKELIIDTFKIPFDIVKVELDYCEKKLRFWAAGKIYAYTKGIESLGEFKPFIMVDNDAGWHTKPPEHFMKSLYRCQQMHNDKNTIFETYYKKILSETTNKFPFDIYHEFKNNPEPLKGGNAGIVVINSEELWREFTRYSWALMESDFFDKIVKQSNELNAYKTLKFWNVTVEENLLLLLSKRILKQMPETVLECTGLSVPIGTYNPTNYFHIWGSKNNPIFIKKYIDIAVNCIDEKITESVYKYFKINGRD